MTTPELPAGSCQAARRIDSATLRVMPVESTEVASPNRARVRSRQGYFTIARAISAARYDAAELLRVARPLPGFRPVVKVPRAGIADDQAVQELVGEVVYPDLPINPVGFRCPWMGRVFGRSPRQLPRHF